MSISITAPNEYTGRASCVRIGAVQLYYSYNTLIGVRAPDVRIRRSNKWGPTTGRHINLLDIRDFPEGTEEQVELTAMTVLVKYCTEWVMTYPIGEKA